MKGILLSGGTGSRLGPLTARINKHLLPVHGRPMIFYPLSTLMSAGIRDILVVTRPEDRATFRSLLGDGCQWGLDISYAAQPRPEGLAQAFLIGHDFIGGSHCALALGDNLLHGPDLVKRLKSAARPRRGAVICAQRVPDPQRFGVVEFDQSLRAKRIEEKPANPTSRYAVPGLYFYDNRVVDFAADLRPSARGELEITDLNQRYLELGELYVTPLDSDFTWLDMGTPESLKTAADFVAATERSQGRQIACPEEIAYRMGFIDADQVERLAALSSSSRQSNYLHGLIACPNST